MGGSCGTCGHPVREQGQRFCGSCGAPLDRAAPEGERKQVTVLFADVAGSMELAERLEPDEWSAIMARLFELCSAAVRAFGGTVDKFTGDGMMAVFGAPVAQEDHARRACHAALRLTRDAVEYGAELRAGGTDLAVRVGLNSGEVVAGSVGASAYTAVGHTVGLAQRMEAHAEPGGVCLSEHTAALVGSDFRMRDLGQMGVKGSSVPVGIFALEGTAGGSAAPGRRRSGAARMVGRDTELARLCAALDAADTGRTVVIGVVGEAGTGKSRLCDELARVAERRGLTVRRTAGISHATDVPLLPVLGLLRDYFGVTDADSAADVRAKVTGRLLAVDAAFEQDLGLVLDFMEVPDPHRPGPALGQDARRARVLDVLRRLTLRRSESAAVLFVLEDLHWFDALSVEFLAGWLPTLAGTRTLVVTNFRPEFRPPWPDERLSLAPLPVGAVDELLGELLGGDPGLRALRGELAGRAGGNAFYVEESVRALAGDGSLAGERGAYRLARPDAQVRVPATVQALLAGRIDRLAAWEKAALQGASVIGRTFGSAVLGAVVDLPTDALGDALTNLCAGELLARTGPGEYRFWHPLTQEVAYGSLVGPTRRRHHAAVAAALLAANPDRHDELAALVAAHYEAAGNHLEAARWLLRAGNRSVRGDFAAGQNQVRSALEHLGAAGESADALSLGVRARTLLLRLGARTGMDVEEADRLFAEARAAVDRLGDPAVMAALGLADGAVRYWIGDAAGAASSWLTAVQHADLTANQSLQAFANLTLCAAYAYAGPLDLALSAAARTVDLCAGDPLVGVDAAGYSSLDVSFLARGLLGIEVGTLEQARLHLAESLAVHAERQSAEFRAWTLSLLARLADARGDVASAPAAHTAAREACALAADAGNIGIAVKGTIALGVAALLMGRAAEAADSLAEALRIARKHRSGLLDEAGALAYLARAHLAQGQQEDARATAREAIAVAERQGARVAQCFACVVLARVLRETAVGGDLTEVRSALASAERLTAEMGAGTSAAFLAEERARLDGGDLASVADGYDAIGATGHARRIRTELGLER